MHLYLFMPYSTTTSSYYNTCNVASLESTDLVATYKGLKLKQHGYEGWMGKGMIDWLYCSATISAKIYITRNWFLCIPRIRDVYNKCISYSCC